MTLLQIKSVTFNLSTQEILTTFEIRGNPANYKVDYNRTFFKCTKDGEPLNQVTRGKNVSGAPSEEFSELLRILPSSEPGARLTREMQELDIFYRDEITAHIDELLLLLKESEPFDLVSPRKMFAINEKCSIIERNSILANVDVVLTYGTKALGTGSRAKLENTLEEIAKIKRHEFNIKVGEDYRSLKAMLDDSVAHPMSNMIRAIEKRSLDIDDLNKELSKIEVKADAMASMIEIEIDRQIKLNEIKSSNMAEGIQSVLDECKTKRDHLVNTHDSLKLMLNKLSEETLAASYSKSSDANYHAYLLFSAALIAVCVFIVVIASTSWSKPIDASAHWASYVGRVSTTIATLFVMAFLARQATEQKRIYEIQKMKASELSILTPFFNECTHEELKEIKKSLIPRYFNSTESQAKHDDEEIKAMLSALPNTLTIAKETTNQLNSLIKTIETLKSNSNPPPNTPST